MKKYFSNSIFAASFAIIILTSCEKDVPGFTDKLKTNSTAVINKDLSNPITSNSPVSMTSIKPKGGIIIWPDTLKTKNP